MEKMKAYLAILMLGLFPIGAYALGSHCASNEKTIWSCQKAKKYYSVCASNIISSTTGYMQYRAGELTKVGFVYPNVKKHPRDTFFAYLGRDFVDLSFKNAQYKYVLSESVHGKSGIDVFKNDNFISHIECDDSTWTLTLTSMLETFSTIGIMKKPSSE